MPVCGALLKSAMLRTECASCWETLQASVDSQSSVGPVPQSGVRDLEKAGHSLHGEKAARRQVGHCP
jgi:hypothetical protein